MEFSSISSITLLFSINIPIACRKSSPHASLATKSTPMDSAKHLEYDEHDYLTVEDMTDYADAKYWSFPNWM